MIVKDRHIPLNLLKLEALLRRLPSNYPKIRDVQQQYARRKAGYLGEKSIDYYLSSSDFQQFFIFHDLRLTNGKYYFQIDTLILTPCFLLILEIKNLSGTLHFDHLNQLIRVNNGKEEGFQNPLSQVFRQRSQLNQWILDHRIPPLPIETLIVISNPSTIIKSAPSNSYQYQKLCHGIDLEERIHFFNNKFSRVILSNKEIKRLQKTLLKNHTPLVNNILSQFDIKKTEILTGVGCPSCSYLPMIRIHGNWQCPHCHVKSKLAHEQAIDDYFLLMNETITSQQFRDFVHLHSKQQATRLLASLVPSSSGTKKGRIYHSPHTPHK